MWEMGGGLGLLEIVSQSAAEPERRRMLLGRITYIEALFTNLVSRIADYIYSKEEEARLD